VYDAPGSTTKGNADTTSKDLAGLGTPKEVTPKGEAKQKRSG
jgi:hypothetical protein